MNDPVAILKRDHREAAAMLKELAAGKPGAARRKLNDKVVGALSLHMEIEEDLVYPLVTQYVGEEESQEASLEHDLARDVMAKMCELVDQPGYGAALAMLTAGIKHHVKEEETEVFPELKKAIDRETLGALGDAIADRKKSRRSRTAVRA
jgi:hemerythrin-like domain-containing protein